jgi:peptide deformylase
LIREVIRVPDARLKQTAPAGADPERVRAAADDLLDTMRSFGRCVGIAAPQVGEDLRLCIVDCSEHPKAVGANHGLLVLVEPEVVEASEETAVGREGCLSLPDLTADVRRATAVTVQATTPAGEPLRIAATGFEARALLHEIDHLDGVLILDRTSRDQRKEAIRALRDAERERSAA